MLRLTLTVNIRGMEDRVEQVDSNSYSLDPIGIFSQASITQTDVILRIALVINRVYAVHYSLSDGLTRLEFRTSKTRTIIVA